MKLMSNGDVVLQKAEIEPLLRHLKRFESFFKVVALQSSKDMLSGEIKTSWAKLKKYFESEELPGSEEKGEVDGRYCCKLTGQGGRIMNCRDYNAWYIFAWAACVAEAIAAGFNATLVSGRCRRVSGCPQCR